MPDKEKYAVSQIQKLPYRSFFEAVREHMGMYMGGNDVSAFCGELDRCVRQIASHRDPGLNIEIRRDAAGAWEIEHDGWEPGGAADETLIASEFEPRMAALPHDGILVAVAAEATVDRWAGGQHMRQSFRQGEPAGPAMIVEPSGRSGRRLRFAPDPSLFVFESASLPIFPLVGRLRELAALIPGCAIALRDAASGRRERIAYPDLAAYFSELAGLINTYQPVFLCSAALADGCRLDLALRFDGEEPPFQRSFVNLERTGGGGTHVAGLWRGLGLALAAHARAIGAWAAEGPIPELPAELLARHVSYLLAVTVPKPEWAGCTRYELASAEIADLIAEALPRELPPILNDRLGRWDSPVRRLLWRAEEALNPASDDESDGD